MLQEVIPTLPSTESPFEKDSRASRAYNSGKSQSQHEAGSDQFVDHFSEQSESVSHLPIGESSGRDENKKNQGESCECGPSLFQELFYFCTVKKIGDLPGSGCIYVETVVDRESGMAFAKVYPTKHPVNAVDILASRVMPFFERRGVAIREIHTRRTREYCGLIPAHPFETFLLNSTIRHLPMDQPGQPCNHLCEEFYRHLLKNFFLAALRKTSELSLENMQKDLDVFVAEYNASRVKQENGLKHAPQPSANFPVDL